MQFKAKLLQFTTPTTPWGRWKRPSNIWNNP